MIRNAIREALIMARDAAALALFTGAVYLWSEAVAIFLR